MPPPSDPSSASVRETNDLLAQQSALWSEIASSTKTMAEALNRVAGNMKNTTEQAGQMRKSMAAATEAQVNGTRDIAAENDAAAQRAESGNKRVQKSIRGLVSDFEEAGTALDRFARQLEADEAAFGWFEVTDALEMASNAARGAGENISGSITAANARVTALVSGVGTLVSGLFNVGKAVLAIPFQLLGLAAEEGNKLLSAKGSGGGGGGGDNSFSLALEDVRDKLGDIATGEGKLVVDMYNQINAEQGNLAGTGLTLAGVFGKQADALKAMQEMYEGLGPLVYSFGDELKTSAVKLTIFQKGLGLSGEELQAFASQASATGKSLTEVLEDTSRMAVTLGNKFGISSKMIAKDFAYMTANSTKFGNLGSKAMGAISVYVRKLGIDIKALEGVMGVFDEFESGAQASAKLSQAFGVQLDSMKMMKAQNPAEQIQMLRDAFAASGKSLEGLSRQQLNYLAQTTGLGDQLQQTLGQASKGMKLGDAEAAAADAASETNRQLMTQSKLLQTLAANIKKLPGEGGGGGGGIDQEEKKFTSFIDAFSAGFKKAIKESKSLKAMQENIALAMMKMYDVGKKVGEFFLKTFPEIEQLFGGIANIFDPKKFALGADKLVEIFENLFKDLKNPATADKAFSKFFDSFIGWFKGMFKNSEASSGIISAVESLVGYMGNALVGAAGFLMEKLADVLNLLADFISGNSTSELISEASETGIGKAFMNAFEKLGDVVEKNWPKLKEALVRLIDIAFEALKPYLFKFMAIYFGMIFIQGIVMGIASAMAAAAVQAAMQKLMQFMDLKMRGGLLKVFQGNAAAATEAAVPTPPEAPGQGGIANKAAKVEGVAGAAAGPAEPTKSLIERFNALKVSDIKKAGEKIWAVVKHIIPPLVLFLIAMLGVGAAILAVPGGLISIATGLAAVGISMLAIAGLVALADTLPTKAQSRKTAEKMWGTGPILLAAIALMAGAAVIGAVVGSITGGAAAIALGLSLVVATVMGLVAISYATKFLKGGTKAAGILLTQGLMMLGASAILIGALGLLVFALNKMEVTPAQIMMVSLAMLVAIGSIILIALGAYALLGVAPDGGFTAALGLAGAGVVIVIAMMAFGLALSFMVKNIISAEEAIQAAKIVGLMALVMVAIGAMVLVILGMGAIMMNPLMWGAIGAGVAAVAGFLILIVPIMGEMLKTIAEAPFDASASMKKIEILQKVFSLLDPLFDMVKMVMQSSGGWATFSTTQSRNIAIQLDSIKEFFKTVLSSLADSIKVIFDAAAKMPAATDADFKRAEMVAAMLDPISNLISSMTSGLEAFAGSAEESSAIGVTTKAGVTAASQLNALKEFLLGPNKDGLFYAVVGSLPDIMKVINEMTAKMSDKEIKSMSAKAEMVGKMVSAIADLAGAFGSIAQAAAALGKTTQKGSSTSVGAGGLGRLTLDTADFDNTFVDMGNIVKFMEKGGPFQTVFDKLKDMLPDLMKKFDEIKITGKPSAVKEKAEAVGAAISMIMSAIQSMLSLVPEGDDMVKVKTDFVIKANSAKIVIQNLLPIIKEIADSFSGISITGTSEEIKSKTESISAVMSTMWTSISNMIGVMGRITEVTTGEGEAAVTVANTAAFEAKGESVKKVMESMSGVIETIVTAFNRIPEPTVTVGTIEDKIFAVENVVGSMMLGASRLMEAFAEGLFARNSTKIGQMKRMSEDIQEFTTLASANLTIVMNAFAGLPEISIDKFVGIEAGFDAISRLGDYVFGIESAVEVMRYVATANLVTLVEETVNSIKTIDEQLSRIENIRLDGRIEKIGKALALKPDSLKIDNKPVNINVQLNLTIDAADLAMELNKVNSRLAVTQPAGSQNGPPQPKPK